MIRGVEEAAHQEVSISSRPPDCNISRRLRQFWGFQAFAKLLRSGFYFNQMYLHPDKCDIHLVISSHLHSQPQP